MKTLVFNRIMKLCAFAVLGLPMACGSGQDLASELASNGPDLKFATPVVQVYLPSLNNPVSISNGQTFHVPCNTQGFRARYRYGNYGAVAAAAHKNDSTVVGSATYSFAQGGLGAATLRDAFASFGQIAVANTPTKISIRLDAGGAVAESDETNNLWVAKVTRHCP